MTSLLLDTSNNDLTVDVNGNIALADAPYSAAQDAACALRLFVGELWYDASQGINYRIKVLGQPLSASYIKATWIAAAKTVPTVASAKAVITRFNNRELQGQVQCTLITGVTVTLQTTGGLPALWYVSGVTP